MSQNDYKKRLSTDNMNVLIKDARHKKSHMIPFICNAQNSKLHKGRKEINDCQVGDGR